MEPVINLELSYQVFNASWTPTYDVRVQTSLEKPRFKLFYFGNIRQNTGEDWNDVELLLSTACPRSGGSLPKLGTLRAQLYKPPLPQPIMPVAPMMAYRPCRAAKMMQISGAHGEESENEELCIEVAQSEKHVLSTTFTIPQRKTIPSNRSEHKVTIVILELESVLHYDCVPSKNTNVFLTASAVNSSTYPLLAGMASVYLDSSFSSKVHLKTVPCGEKFDCSLGVDSTVKVEYKPAYKFLQQLGMINRFSSDAHEQRILVKNSKAAESVLLKIVEHLPKSGDEKIKMKLVSPELIHPHSVTSEESKTKLQEIGPILNDDHNLEWTVWLAEQEEKELLVKWVCEYPPNETIEYKEDTC